MTKNHAVFGVAFLVTVVAALSPFFSNKPALAGCGWGDITCSPPSWSYDSSRLSTLEFCNNTNFKLYIAYVKFSGNQDGWVANGWKGVKPRSCDTLDIGISQGDIFLYAKNKQGKFYGGRDAYFCVDKGSAFNFANADTRNCNAGSLKKVGTTKWKVDSGTNTYNFN
jgi:uncharacterized membrane protein